MPSEMPKAVVVDSWEELASHAVNAAIRWHRRNVQRWGSGEEATKEAEIGFVMELVEGAANGSAQLSLHAPEGSMEFSLGLQVQFDTELVADPAVAGEFARNVVAPMLVSYLRGAVTSESQIMGWNDLILPPTVEQTLRQMTDDQLLGETPSE